MDDMGRRDFLTLGTGLVTGITAASLSAQPDPASGAEVALSANPIQLEIKDRLLRFRADWCDIPDWKLTIETENELLQTTDARVEIIHQEPLQVRFHLKRQLTWEVQAETDHATNRLILHSTLRNDSQRPVALGKAVLLQTDRVTGFFRAGDDLVYLAMSTGQGLNQVQVMDAKPAPSDIAIQAFNQNQKKALQVGFATLPAGQDSG